MAETIKFEKALEKLESIVADLESGDISLEEALKKYEEGIHLSGVCQKHLMLAEKKVETLSRKADGSFELKETATEEEHTGARKSGAGRRKREDADDIDEGEGDYLL